MEGVQDGSKLVKGCGTKVCRAPDSMGEEEESVEHLFKVCHLFRELAFKFNVELVNRHHLVMRTILIGQSYDVSFLCNFFYGNAIYSIAF